MFQRDRSGMQIKSQTEDKPVNLTNIPKWSVILYNYFTVNWSMRSY